MPVVVTRLLGLLLTVGLVVANAIAIELLLDGYGVRLHRLFTGLLGTALIAVSFGYSLRKRRLVSIGSTRGWLKAHEWLAIAGCFVIFVHTGTHIEAMVPVLTLIVLFVTFISGLFGRYLYTITRDELRAKLSGLSKEGIAPSEQAEHRLWALTVASTALSRWRALHIPIVSLFAMLLVYHVLSALYFKGI